MHNAPRVLLVDDEVEFVNMLASLMRMQNLDVQTATGGIKALQIMTSGDFDLLVTDINMPEMDGVELIREVKKIKPDLKIMVMTAYPSKGVRDESTRLGVLDYIIKPFPINDFFQLLKKRLNTA